VGFYVFILGQVQKDASWLNPAHEDNYYIATAILPWEGQVDPTQVILRRATLARFFDYQPPFYYAFNQVHFKGDAFGASEWLRQAAEKLPDPEERVTLADFAARWLDRTRISTRRRVSSMRWRRRPSARILPIICVSAASVCVIWPPCGARQRSIRNGMAASRVTAGIAEIRSDRKIAC
jgi:hypothetical protein